MGVRDAALAAMSMLVAAVAVSGTAGAQQQAADPVESFLDAAYGPARDAGSRLYRWPGDVTVRFSGAAPARYLGWAEEQLGELQAATGRSISRIDAIGADILVVFVPSFEAVLDGRYNDLIDRFAAGEARRTALLEGLRQARAVCAGQANARGSELAAGLVFVPVDRLAPVVRSCISAQIARVLGLPFPLPGDAPSVLAEASPHSHLTGLDRTMLALLYHPRMKAGMSLSDAETVARSVLPALRQPD